MLYCTYINSAFCNASIKTVRNFRKSDCLEEFCTCIYSCLGRLVLKVVGFLKTLKCGVKINVNYKFEESCIFRKIPNF